MVSTNLYFLWQKGAKSGVLIAVFSTLLKRENAMAILATFVRIVAVILLIEDLISRS